MAAPHVTGAVALMLEVILKPIGIHQIRNILLGSTDHLDVDPNDKLRIGSGLLNIRKALRGIVRYNRISTARKNQVMPRRLGSLVSKNTSFTDFTKVKN